MVRIPKTISKHLLMIFALALISVFSFACGKNKTSIQIESNNDVLISGVQEYAQTTISVKSSKKVSISYDDWNKSITSDLSVADNWHNYLTINVNDNDNQCVISFINQPPAFDDFNLFIRVIIGSNVESNQLTINVRHGEPLDAIFINKTFDFANIGSPTEQFFARSAFAFNENTIPSGMNVKNLIFQGFSGYSEENLNCTYSCDIPKYFDTTTFSANLRGDSDNVKFQLDKIIPPAFCDFSQLDYSFAIKLPANIADWDANTWSDLQFDFGTNFANLMPDAISLGFDNYFQVIHWDHIEVDSIDISTNTLTLKGDNSNYYTSNIINFTGVEFN